MMPSYMTVNDDHQDGNDKHVQRAVGTGTRKESKTEEMANAKQVQSSK